MDKTTVKQALDGWSQSGKERKISEKDIKNAQTALKRYVLPGLGLGTEDLATKGFGDFLAKLYFTTLMQACQRLYDKNVTSLETQDSTLTSQFPSPKENIAAFILQIFDQQFDAAVATGILSAESKRNYRPPLGRFLKWVMSQLWWHDIAPENMPELAPIRPKVPKKPTTRSRQEPYALKKEELPEPLLQQLEAYRQFRLDGGEKLWRQLNREKRKSAKLQREVSARQQRVPKPSFKAVSESTYRLEEKRFLEFFGWVVNIEKIPVEDLKLELLLDLFLLEDYRDWKIEKRQLSHSTILQLLNGSSGVAKFNHISETQHRNWSDIQVIRELRELQSECKEFYVQEHEKNCDTTWDHQLLTHEELERLLPYLRQRCAPYTSKVSKSTEKAIKGEKQSDARVLWYYQAYLLVKLFVYLPNRSEEPRQYVEGKTLFRELDEQNEYRYFAKNITHKNQRYNGLRNYPLPNVLTADIDTWLRKYRPRVEWALQSLENWLNFWGQELGQLEKVQQRLDAAYQGVFSPWVKNKQAYISELEKTCKALQNRIDAYPIAKAAFEENNSVFFHFGFSRPQAFGKPLSSTGVHAIIQPSVAEASKAVLDKTRWTSPHRFRHIAEDQADNPQVSEMLNHDPEMGGKYRKQIAKRSIRHKGVVDNWWKNPRIANTRTK